MPALEPMLTRGCGPPTRAGDKRAKTDSHIDAFHRLAAMDPPVLRSLVVELKRMSDESAACAALAGTAEAAARACRNAERAAAACAALDAVDTED